MCAATAATTRKQSFFRRIGASAVSTGSVDHVTSLADKFGGENIKFDKGLGELPRITLSSGDSSAEIYLYGAVVTSWNIPSGEDLLFVRPDAVFTGAKPISGGVPHCFPQFGPGQMQQHGFARNLSWEVEAASAGTHPSVTLKLSDSEYTRAMWDFAFTAHFKIALVGSDLSTVLTVENNDSKAFDFTAALHTYFRAAIADVKVSGLKGLKFLNKDPDPTNPIPGVEEREEVTFPGFVDCMYLNAPSELVLDNGLGRKISIKNTGWSDAVVWSPYLTMEACYKDFVCVENAKLDKVVVEPGKTWVAEQTLSLI